MKRLLYFTFFTVLMISGLTAVFSCGTSSTPDGNTTVKPTEPGATPGPDFTPGGTAEVTMENLEFSPATLTVEQGTTVLWTNDDSVTHTVTFRTINVDSGSLPRGAEFSHTFRDAGEFEYYCTLHSGMTGKIIVK